MLIAKMLPSNLHGWAFCKVYQERTVISVTKVWSDPKVNDQIEKELNP